LNRTRTDEERHYARCDGSGTTISVRLLTMNRNLALILIVFSGVIVLVVAGAVILQTVATSRLAEAVAEVAPALDVALESFADEQTDAGFSESQFDASGPLLKDRRVLISNDINARTARDVTSRLLFLDSEDSTAPIDLYISTQGGWIDNAFTIIDTMRLIDAPVNTWAIGGCYSSGALILTSGTGTRRATENAIIMIHADLGDSTADYSFERLSRERYERVWSETSELPDDWFPMTDAESYYLSPDEALELGVIDEITPIWNQP
jgi:ATP-dependent Clp protease protease subunit